jgi:hypothetical protein
VAKFQSFWFGESLSPYQILAMKSFVDFGHDYVLYAYQKFDVPAGVQLRDAREILPRDRIFFYGKRAAIGAGSVSGFSNLFRYRLLHELGGWWVDADVICLSKQVPAAEVFLGWEDEWLIGSAILKFPPRHAFMGEMLDIADRAGTDLEWGETGPYLLTRLARERGILPLVATPAESFPVPSHDALQTLMPARREEVREKTQNLALLHLWNEVLRRAVVFTWMAPPPGSFVADLFARHGVTFGAGRAYTAEEMQRLNANYQAFIHWEWYKKQAAAAEQAAALRLDGTVRQLHGELEALKASNSWRLTAPLRRLASALRSGSSRPA